MKNRAASLFALACLALVVPAIAREETIRYDDRDFNTTTTIDGPSAGDIEAVRFSALSPWHVQKVYFRLTGAAGDIEIHIWADDGEGHPDTDSDLVDPVTIPAEGEGKWANHVFDPPLDIPEPAEIHIGMVKLADEPRLLSDRTPNILRRSQMRVDGHWMDNEIGDYLIQADVDWYDEPTEYTFEDVTADADVEIGGRVAWCDLDGDGLDDICSAGIRVLANRGDGTFRDVTETAGLAGIPASGCLCADFDNDGHLDLFASLNSLEDYDRLLRNNGDGTFTDVTREMIAEEDLDYLPTEGAAWGDVDNDGYVDLYLANYEIYDPEHPDELGNCTQDKLYYNVNGERFIEVALQAGMDEGLYPLCGRGVNWGDFDSDGDLDIYVSNYRLDPNYLWENLGEGRFEDVAREKGVQGFPTSGAYGHTIGSTWADFNDDGYLDLLILNLAHPRFIDFSDISALYINQGPPDFTFVDVIADSGIFYDEVHSHPAVGDYDNDGNWDVLVTCVYESRASYLFRGLGDARFEDATYLSGVRLDNGWGAAWSDYDADGLLDLLAWDRFSRFLWHNTGLGAEGNHWLSVRTFGTDANRASIGTRVEVTAGGRTLTQVVSGGSGTTCQDSAALHFGLGTNTTADRVKITWLGGGEKTLTDVAADQFLVITEGEEDDDTGDDDAAGDEDDDGEDAGCGC